MSPRRDDQLTEVERIEQILRTGEWVRPASSTDDVVTGSGDVPRTRERRRWHLGLAAAAAVGGVVLGGVGLAQVMAPGNPRPALTPVVPPASGPSSADGSVDKRDRQRSGSSPESIVRLAEPDSIRVDTSTLRRWEAAVRFSATVTNRTSGPVSIGGCNSYATQVIGRTEERQLTWENVLPENADCLAPEPLAVRASRTEEFVALSPRSRGPLTGRSLRWSLAEHPEAAVTFVMSDESPLRVIGVLTIDRLPTAQSDAFTLAYENVGDELLYERPCELAVIPSSARRTVAEAYVANSAVCNVAPIEPGDMVAIPVDLDLPTGTERVRVRGPLGSEIVVPLVRPK